MDGATGLILGMSWGVLLGFIVLGIGVGALGTLIGAGGGLIFVPVFLYLFTDWSPAMVVGTSLTIVMFNAMSASTAFIKQKKILYSAAIWFTLATIPGSYLGAVASEGFDISMLKFWFGLFLLCMSTFIGYKNWTKGQRKEESLQLHELTYSKTIGCLISVVVGFISSVFGIGGGLIHVAALVYILGFPTHVATATSQFILFLSTITGVVTHYSLGHIQWNIAIACGIGAVIGAQLGAAIAKRLKATSILMVFSLGVGILALRLIWTSGMLW